jgi:TRAP-type C4-dicarboxylate transport system substrate-binding protein
VRTPADLKGLKFRMMGNPIFVDTANALGANGVAMGMDQVMNALQTGVVDGAENNPPSYDSFGHVPVAKHYSLTEHLIIPEILVYSKKSFDSLSKEDQALVLKFGKETQLEERALWYVRTKQAREKIKAAGVNVIEIADKKLFQDAVKPVWDKYGAKYADLVKQIQDTK